MILEPPRRAETKLAQPPHTGRSAPFTSAPEPNPKPLTVPPAVRPTRPEQRVDAVSFLGVDYTRVTYADGGELYLTRFGASFRRQLDPANWHAPEWFAARHKRLPGTSCIHRLPTRPAGGVTLNLVVRFSRVGEDVPLDTFSLCQYPNAEFNSPFEEFSLVMDLRAARPDPARGGILTKKPLAIYVPAQRIQLWQTGRREGKIAAKQARHPGVPLDILRQYILLYGWIGGRDAVQTADALGLRGESREVFLTDVTRRAVEDLRQRGFRMVDIKPQHILLRFRTDGSLLRKRDGQPAYALLDYELLERC